MMRLAMTTLALAPLLVVQGWYVKRITPRLPEAEGARQGITGQGQRLRLLVVGDSAAAGVGAVHQREALVGQLTAELAAQFEVSWLLIAKTGFTTADLLAHLAQQRSQHFDVAVVSLGVNDVTRRVATRHWLKQQQELVELLATKFGVQKVLLSAV
ncbi:MAG TPA: SGNH/GDSL hydrolase family protein, partial [Agitococcus sp.]|nr:SGNH/GDSL hydrolase family protein [Agitococcus sp.]